MSRTNSLTWLLAAVCVAGAVVATQPVATAGASPTRALPQASGVTVPPGSIFYTAGTGETYAGYPAIFDGSSTAGNGTRNTRFTLSYGTKSDSPGKGGSTIRQSTDAGASWPAFPSLDGYLVAMNFVRLAISSGGVIEIDFEDRSVTEKAAGTCTDLSICRRQFNRRMMTPTSWIAEPPATVTFSRAIAWARFHQGPILLGDGKTLLSTMYGVSADGTTPFTAVVRSIDDGQTWTQVSELAAGSGWSEASLAPTSDGGLIAAMRKDENYRGVVPANVALYTRHSSNPDGSGPWDAPVRLSSDDGNSPSLERLGDGALVLASGRLDNQLRFSLDGRGTSWTTPSVPYVNYARTGGQPDGWYKYSDTLYRPMRHLGSSGTVGIAPITSDSLLVVGDNCGTDWGCPAGAGGYDVGKQSALWKTTATVDTGRTKLDLFTMFQQGQLTVVNTTPSRYGYCPGGLSGCRQSLAAYAFDGDPRTDSSLVTADRSVTLRLPHAYSIAGLGIEAYCEGSSDVKIETSSDGSNFVTPARGTRTGIVRPFTTPVSAQYIRISDPNPITDTTAGFLNEVELYTSLGAN